jgi:hypothetical protein
MDHLYLVFNRDEITHWTDTLNAVPTFASRSKAEADKFAAGNNGITFKFCEHQQDGGLIFYCDRITNAVRGAHA